MKNLVAAFLGVLFLMSFTLTPPDQKLFGKKWMIVSFKGYPKETFVKNKAYVQFDKRGKNIAIVANVGCNTLNFPVKFDKDGKEAFTTKQGISTLMYCEEVMKLEKEFGDNLKGKVSYKIEGHTLTLTNDKNEVIKLVAQDWD